MAGQGSNRSLDGILNKYELERKDLDFKCPPGTRDRVADELVDDWRKIGRTLNVSETKLKSIRHDNTFPRPEDKASASLDAWAEEYGESATCLLLAKALYRHKKRNVLEILCKEVQRVEKHATTSKPNACEQPPQDKQRQQKDVQRVEKHATTSKPNACEQPPQDKQRQQKGIKDHHTNDLSRFQ